MNKKKMTRFHNPLLYFYYIYIIKFIGPTCHAMGTHSLNNYFGAVKKNLQ